MRSRTRQLGVTLIELMIALALGLFLTSGLIYLYLGSKASYSTQGAVANVQESLRFGFEYLAFDIRMAGYMGCANVREMTPQIVADPPLPSLGLGGSLVGYDSGTGWTNPSTITRIAGTDVISISRASMSSIHLSQNSSGSEFKINSPSPHGFVADQVLIVTDCRRSDVFRATAVSATTGSTNIAHASNKNTQPAGSKCASGSGKLVTECDTPGNYKNDAQLASLEGWSYFIGLNPRNNPALYRVSTITSVAEELVEGVFDMQLQYGLDTVPDTQYLADSYSSTPGDWKQVVSVKLTIRARSPDDAVIPNAISYTYNGTAVSDRRYQQSYTTVIGLRNLVQ